MRQLTILNSVESVGIGLHKGEPIRIVLEPMEADTGIVFYRSDLGVGFKALPEYVINTQMATVVGNEHGSISTIEHLLSAIWAYGIDNIRVVVDGPEIPVMDGSSGSFCMMLDEAKIRPLEAYKRVLIVRKIVEVQEGSKFARVVPSKTPTFRFTIHFDHVAIGRQEYHFEFGKKAFLDEIARARTFGFMKDVQMLRSRGLALGGSLDNAVVMDEKKILNPEGLRYSDEFVRHKILDAIGDLALLGAPMIGDYESFAGSHHLNHLLTKEILKDPSNYEIKTLVPEVAQAYEKVFA
ncbi:MAG: UDP-3-O-acyl-N-acetylglucosamine deacetylase [Campylobacterales bacterium]|nr:UDP-3-O-acyl-N-acetylglucosamine deacetylase [Campylobacterales bacterium]